MDGAADVIYIPYPVSRRGRRGEGGGRGGRWTVFGRGRVHAGCLLAASACLRPFPAIFCHVVYDS